MNLYQDNKKGLIIKLGVFLALTVIITILSGSLIVGLSTAGCLYLPIYIAVRLPFGIIISVVIAFLGVALFVDLMMKWYPFTFIIIAATLINIGYSVFKVVRTSGEQASSEQDDIL